MGGVESQLAPNTVRRAKGRDQRKLMLEEIMKEYDKSQTGTLKRGEVKTMATKILGRVAPAMGGLSYEEIELIMCLGGRDSRPEITAEELPEALAIISSIKEENEELEKLFRKHDVDKSGDLPAAQLKALLTEVNGGAAPSDDDVTYVLKQCEPRGVADPIKKQQLKAAICCWYYASEEDVKKSAREEREKEKVTAAKAKDVAKDKKSKPAEKNENVPDPIATKHGLDKKLELPIAQIRAEQDEREKKEHGSKEARGDRAPSRAEELLLDEGNRKRAADHKIQEPVEAKLENVALASPRPETRPPPETVGGSDKAAVHALKEIEPVPKVDSIPNGRMGERSEEKEPKLPEPSAGVFQAFLFGSCRPCCRVGTDASDVRDAEAPVVYDAT